MQKQQKEAGTNGKSCCSCGWHTSSIRQMGRLAGEGDATALEVFRRVGSFIGLNIKEKIKEYKIECLLFGGQISRSFRFMEEAVRNELRDISDLKINTVSDFSNAAFKGLVEMINNQYSTSPYSNSSLVH